ncbi:MAG: hypothetical protein WCX12_00930 [Candidatus Paceibacterota bacterium]|jgi:hypothetical protein
MKSKTGRRLYIAGGVIIVLFLAFVSVEMVLSISDQGIAAITTAADDSFKKIELDIIQTGIVTDVAEIKNGIARATVKLDSSSLGEVFVTFTPLFWGSPEDHIRIGDRLELEKFTFFNPTSPGSSAETFPQSSTQWLIGRKLSPF